MTIIDPSTPLGQCRLRCADFSDLVILPDSVYNQALLDNNNNVPNASKTCALYILGVLSQKTDRQMGLQLVVKGSQAFAAYKEFLLLTVNNPAFMSFSPIAMESLTPSNRNVLVDFVNDFNKNYYYGTQSQRLALDADIGPNDGSRYGPLGNLSTVGSDGSVGGSGWVVP